MIAEVRFKNLFSFRDETALSFEATDDKSMEDVHIVEVEPGVRLLKLGIIYGANASGKTNVLNVLDFFGEFLFGFRANKNESLNYEPFLLNGSSVNEPSEIGLTFYVKTKKDYERYVYNVEFFKNTVLYEELLHYKSNRPTTVFERKLENDVSVISFNKQIKMSSLVKKEIELKCLPNMSVFTATSMVNTVIKELKVPESYLVEKFLFPSLRSDEQFPQSLSTADKDYERGILTYLQEADFNITNVKYSTKTDPSIRFLHTVKNSEGTYNGLFSEEMESAGTLRTFILADYINHLLEEKGLLRIDEMESSLHPKLLEYVIEKFLKSSTDQQMLFTTHYDGILAEEDLIRKDNIWFTAKGEDGASVLYPLTDFKGLNRISSLQKAYKMGKFGAIPNI